MTSTLVQFRRRIKCKVWLSGWQKRGQCLHAEKEEQKSDDDQMDPPSGGGSSEKQETQENSQKTMERLSLMQPALR